MRAKARQAGAETQIVALDAARAPQAEPLTLDDIAERVQRILDDPTREADEHDDSVLQALQERRAAGIEAEQRSAAAGQEELTAGTSGGDDEPERSAATDPIEDIASSQELSDDAQVEYDEWTGERLDNRGQDRNGTQPLYDEFDRRTARRSRPRPRARTRRWPRTKPIAMSRAGPRQPRRGREKSLSRAG